MTIWIDLPGLPVDERDECMRCGTEEDAADIEARGGLCVSCYWVPGRCMCGTLTADGSACARCPKCGFPMCPNCEEDYYRSNAGNCVTCRFA